MTTGAWLSRIARHLLRAEAYDAVVMPAIADLQYEATRGTWSRWRASAGASRAIAAAVVLEIADDCRTTMQSVRPGSLVGPPLAAFLAVAVLYVAPMLWFWRTSAPWHHQVILLGLLVLQVVSAIVPVTALPTAAALAQRGHPGSTRAALVLTVSTVMALILVSHEVERKQP